MREEEGKGSVKVLKESNPHEDRSSNAVIRANYVLTENEKRKKKTPAKQQNISTSKGNERRYKSSPAAALKHYYDTERDKSAALILTPSVCHRVSMTIWNHSSRGITASSVWRWRIKVVVDRRVSSSSSFFFFFQTLH